MEIDVPDGQKHTSTRTIPRCKLGMLHYRPLVGVIRAAFESKASMRFHYTPFKKYWQATSHSEERIYDELYTSDVWINAQCQIQEHAQQIGEQLECAIAALMLWSDSTHLTNFGNASLWPIYAFFGNQSKYERAQPSAHACHHLAYIPSVSFLETPLSIRIISDFLSGS